MLCEERPDRYADGQLRTLQRRVKAWRAAHGPEREVVLGQRHRAGEAAQTDFTTTAELGVTIAGQAFVHLLCVLVLPYSNWQWATVCLSESLAALRRGVQRALFQLGRVPRHHQTDNSTAATHRIPRRRQGLRRRPQATVQRRLPRDDAALQDDAADDRSRSQGARTATSKRATARSSGASSRRY
ncbi:MAG: hypothetical protein H6708_31520 [Kofleriaceae bacterium]|nr:hypothetical protein [Kofleriaceae bacterium]